MLLLALILPAGYVLLMALGPTTFYDSLTYHLALPDLFLRRGRIEAVPMNVFSGLPQGIEMLYLWLLPWNDGGSLCQLLHWSFGFLTAIAVAMTGKRLGYPTAGVWAAAIFYSNPMVLMSSGKPAVELGWSFYLALCLLVLIVYARTQNKSWLVFAGIFAGLVLGTKYQAILLLPAAAVFLRHCQAGRDSYRDAWRVCLIAGIIAAPWLIRNIAFYRNPVFPFLDGSVFPSSGSVEPGGLRRAAGRGLAETFTTWNGFREFALHPFTYSFPSRGSYKEDVLSVVYLLILPLVLSYRLESLVWGLLAFAGALWLPMNIISAEARFSIPALAPLSLIAALPLEWLRGAPAVIVRGIVIVLIAFNGLYVLDADARVFWPSLQGGLPEMEYLSHHHTAYPCPPFPTFHWANEHLPAESKVLFIGEGRSFYLERDRENASPYALEPLVLYANAASSGADIYDALQKHGISHIFINGAEIVRQKEKLRFTVTGWANFRSFWKTYLQLLFMDRNEDRNDARSSLLFKILDKEESARPHPEPPFPFGS